MRMYASIIKIKTDYTDIYIQSSELNLDFLSKNWLQIP